jgi:alpha-1,2-mannosyltransferase
LSVHRSQSAVRRIPLLRATTQGQPAAGHGRRWLSPVEWAVVVATAVALGLRLYQLTQPGHFLGVTSYDDGVYVGAAVRLIDGVPPYRDFVLVQPPGVVLLMTPVAALGKLTGTAWAMGLGRLLTACAGAASVPLIGLLVRHRGLLAVVISCGVMAVYPDAILAAQTVLQEPWLVLACLAGMLAVFDGDRLTTSGKRLAWGGVAFGFAGAIKLWAVFPIVVIAIMCLPRIGRVLTYLGGVAAGFLVPVLPFFAIAPSSFFRGVVLAQLVRVDDARVPLTTRLADLSGIVASQSTVVQVPAVFAALAATLIVALVVGSYAGVWLLTPRPLRATPFLPPLERFVLVTAVIIVVAFLWPVDFYYHYAAFFAPFLALAVALPVARLVRAARPVLKRRWPGLRFGRTVSWVIGIAFLAMFTAAVVTETVAPASSNPAAAADRVIPRGACVLTDQVSFTIMANRFISSVPGCPQLVDGFGTDLDLSKGHNGATGAARTPAVRQIWDHAFRHAQYVWLSSKPDRTTGSGDSAYRRIAWTPALRVYLERNFREVSGNPLIYKRIDLSS